ncbi:HtaA domain-containing protein [Pimelobacter simplex]|uniref:HtaA domain-containing protein n=1 Tax=Nocardioides simplex TaxID=2045 RepID=UPI003AACBC06
MKRLVLALLALVLPLAGLSLVAPAPVARAATTDLSSGTVSWGIKASWRSYIGSGTSGGDGVVIRRAPNGVADGFDFPVTSGTYDDATRSTTLRLGGWVRFQAYPEDSGRYALDSTFKDLEVRIGPDAQEIRGTYVGYSREDPGGALHEDVDVVLATLDVAGAAGTSFAEDRSTWDAIPSQGGEGQRLYAPGTAFDPVTIAYDGPGGIPDLAERFDQPGAPVLSEGARWLSGSTVSGGANAQRSLEVSARGDLVYATQFDAAHGAQKLIVTALDAQDLTPVGTPYTHTMVATGGSGRFLRTALDPVTDTFFFVTSKDGAGQNEVTLRTLRFEREAGTFTAGVAGVLLTSTAPGVSALTWNRTAGELGVVVLDGSTASEQNPYRLVRVGADGAGGWTVRRAPISWAPAGDFPGGWSLANGTPAMTGNAADPNLAALGDGSYVLALSAARVTAGGTDHYAPAFRLKPTGDSTVETVGIPGTEARLFYEGSGVFYGWTAAVAGPEGSVYLHGNNQRLADYQRVTLDGGQPVARPAVEGEPIPQYRELGIDTSRAGWQMAYDAERDLLWATDDSDAQGRTLKVVDDTGTLAGYRVAEYAQNGGTQMVIETGVDGSVYVPVQSAANPREIGYRRMVLEGIAPRVTTQPEDAAVELAVGEASRPVTFTAAIDTALGGTVQWQARRAGEVRFANLPGATSPALQVDATPAAAGTTYRMKVANDAGTVVSAEASLAVTFAPRFALDARHRVVTEGADATFVVHAEAGPALTALVWQRRVGGYWQPIPADDDNVVVESADGISSLTVVGTNLDQSGSLFRAKAVNAVGTTYSTAARLTVNPKRAVPAEGLTLDGVVLEWAGNGELQVAPPFGGSNYLSAGVSDGDQATYRASAGDVAVVHRAADGSESPATWATRAAPAGGSVDQLVRLSGGRAELAADGSATIRWKGAFSVNFYGGLVPFWFTDPVLEVTAGGTGTLTADLDGYGSSQADPNQRTPLDAVPGVRIATFDALTIDPAGKVAVTPAYDGVEVALPASATPQHRTGAGWGAWPQAFVDFHLATGLASYWYSSGGAADVHKAPAPVTVDLTDAEEVDPEPGAATVRVTLDDDRVGFGTRPVATVAVSAPGTPPSGTVEVRVLGRTLRATLASGTARVVLPGDLPAGRHPVVATYGTGTGAGTGTGRTTLTVAKAAPAVTAKLPAKVRSGKRAKAVKVRVVVGIPGDGRAAYTGQVVVRDGGRVLAVRSVRHLRGAVVVTVPRSVVRGLRAGRHYWSVIVTASPDTKRVATPLRAVRVRR